jgi:glyoxylase-like metal-dependent hydrolase (beta-lactamase superfamily II)
MAMKIHILETGKFKLDGGAMFGVVPKKLWHKLNPPDDHNMCTWSMRCLFIESGSRKIIVDTGIGNKQSDKFRSHFEPHGEDTLLKSLSAIGYQPEDITDVLITHLHFDHVGGATYINERGENVPLFPNATYWSNEVHYQWAAEPNAREKASFLKENFVPLKQSGQLRFVEVQKDDIEWLEGIQLRFVYGHTEAMMMPIIDYNGSKLVYCADLIPSSFHISMPYVMAYDIRPLNTIDEKGRLLEEALANDWLLFFEHDPVTACVNLKRNERGRIVAHEKVALI